MSFFNELSFSIFFKKGGAHLQTLNSTKDEKKEGNGMDLFCLDIKKKEVSKTSCWCWCWCCSLWKKNDDDATEGAKKERRNRNREETGTRKRRRTRRSRGRVGGVFSREERKGFRARFLFFRPRIFPLFYSTRVVCCCERPLHALCLFGKSIVVVVVGGSRGRGGETLREAGERDERRGTEWSRRSDGDDGHRGGCHGASDGGIIIIICAKETIESNFRERGGEKTHGRASVETKTRRDEEEQQTDEREREQVERRE